MDPTLRLSLLTAAAGGGLDLTNILVGLISGGAVLAASIITNRVAGRASKTNAMLQWASQMQASEQAARNSEQAARKEARESDDRAERIRDEADADIARLRAQTVELEGRLAQFTRQVAKLTDTVTLVQAEVWGPDPSIEVVRRLVGRPPSVGINGQTV